MSVLTLFVKKKRKMINSCYCKEVSFFKTFRVFFKTNIRNKPFKTDVLYNDVQKTIALQ